MISKLDSFIQIAIEINLIFLLWASLDNHVKALLWRFLTAVKASFADTLKGEGEVRVDTFLRDANLIGIFFKLYAFVVIVFGAVLLLANGLEYRFNAVDLHPTRTILILSSTVPLYALTMLVCVLTNFGFTLLTHSIMDLYWRVKTTVIMWRARLALPGNRYVPVVRVATVVALAFWAAWYLASAGKDGVIFMLDNSIVTPKQHSQPYHPNDAWMAGRDDSSQPPITSHSDTPSRSMNPLSTPPSPPSQSPSESR